MSDLPALPDTPPGSTEAPPPPGPTEAPPPPGLPMAVSLVSAIIGVTATVMLTIGGLYAWALWRCGALRPEHLAAGLPTTVCTVGGQVMVLNVRGEAPDRLYLLAMGAVLLVLLFGFRRLRRWAWVGLMAWSGLNLFVALFRYFTLPDRPAVRFLTLFLNTVLVLALNAEEVQEAFGLRQRSEAPPVRSDASKGPVTP